MNKADLVESLSNSQSLTKKAATGIVESVFAAIEHALLTEGEVRIPELFTVKVVTRAAREGVNPTTKKKIQIPSARTLKIKTAVTLKNRLN